MRSETEINRAVDEYADMVRRLCIHQLIEQPAPQDQDYTDVLEAVLSLPKKYKDVVYLYYYEGYTAPQISKILGKNVNTIYTLLNRSKKILKAQLGGSEYE